MTTSTPFPAALRTIAVDDWTLHEFASLGSTNLVARTLAPWHAVRADVQTGGYGRTGRAWVSDPGGLWISAVLPTPGPREKWAILPLAAGWAVIQALESMNVGNLRLRWPNDIMSGRRKLAGLLLEQFQPGATVIGLGLNVFNRPEDASPELQGRTATLRELAPGDYTIGDVARLLLQSLSHLHALLEQNGFAAIAHLINLQWDNTRRVELALNTGVTLRGRFKSIDAEGRLITEIDGRPATYSASEVALLREID
jgi:BirA family biotin operon repressor/biotin-[acetyl-CoA-carboxylase] ligase